MRLITSLLSACLLIVPAMTKAQSASATTLVVIQSGLGNSAGDAVRAQLASQFSLRVVTMREVTTGNDHPDALLTIALDSHGTLSAMYWQRNGTVDVFSAQAPTDPAALQVAALTLASAVLQRHITELRAPLDSTELSSRPDEATASIDRVVSPTALYTALTRLGLMHRRTVDLRLEDF